VPEAVDSTRTIDVHRVALRLFARTHRGPRR
jgi:hypothetical protein